MVSEVIVNENPWNSATIQSGRHGVTREVRDTNGKIIFFQNPDGFMYEKKWDSKGRCIYYSDSKGVQWEHRPGWKGRMRYFHDTPLTRKLSRFVLSPYGFVKVTKLFGQTILIPILGGSA
jgi:hypothetical protein